MPTQPPVPSHQARTRLATAAPPLFNINDFLQTLPATTPARHPPLPNCAKPRQTTPISHSRQNKATPTHSPSESTPFRTENPARLSTQTFPGLSLPKAALSTVPRPLSTQNSTRLSTQNSALSTSPPARQKVPTCAKARRQPTDSGKTKPPRPPRPLTANQLLAATLLVAGRSTTAIADQLQINRHTLARWKRSIPFQNELRFQINVRLARSKTEGSRQ